MKNMVKAKALIEGIKDFEIKVIPKEENQEVDPMSKYAFAASPWNEIHCVETSIDSIIKG